MLEQLHDLRKLARDLDPIVRPPLVMGEAGALTRLLLRLVSDLTEEVMKSHPSYVSLGDLEVELARWHTRRYGMRPVHMPATHKKLLEEFTEFQVAFQQAVNTMAEGDKAAAAAEAVDMIFVLHHLMRGLGVSLPWAIIQKFQVIEKRLADDSYGRGSEPKALPPAAKIDAGWMDQTPTPPVKVKDVTSPAPDAEAGESPF